MPPIPNNSNYEDELEDESDECEESECTKSGSESDTESECSTLEGGDSVNSDEEEYFIRFDSTTNYDHVDYVMIGSSCYEIPDDNITSNTPVIHNNQNSHIECQHDVLVYFINGYVDQQMMDKREISDICRLQGIDLSSHNIFSHLLD